MSAVPSKHDATSTPPATLGRWLETIHRRFHHRRYLPTDPLQVLYRFEDPDDREVVALIAASLAYGNVKAILGGIEDVLGRLGPSPRRELDRLSDRQLRSRFRGFRYRVTSAADMTALLRGAKRLAERHGRLEAAFASHGRRDDQTILPALGGWVGEMCEAAGRPLHHLLPHPDRGSACKRLNLMLRWLVRRDRIDPGGWPGIPRRRLLVPLDTHMHQVARRLELTRRKQPSLAAALEVTEKLRAIRPDDPLRYDFALTRPGIMRLADRDLFEQVFGT